MIRSNAVKVSICILFLSISIVAGQVDQTDTVVTGAYEWTVSGVISESVLFKITDEEYPNVFDTSDNTFIVYECLLKSIADLNNDCYVNLKDVAVMASNWLICGNPYDSVCDK